MKEARSWLAKLTSSLMPSSLKVIRPELRVLAPVASREAPVASSLAPALRVGV